MDYLVSAGLTSKKGMSNDEKKKKNWYQEKERKSKEEGAGIVLSSPYKFQEGRKNTRLQQNKKEIYFQWSETKAANSRRTK